MKNNKLISTLAVFAAASLFTGCFNGVDLTETKEEVANYNATAVEDYENNYYSKVFVSSNLTAKATGNVVLTIYSTFSLDTTTLANAISVVGLKSNENSLYADEDAALTISSISSNETLNSAGDYVKTVVTLAVDLTSYDSDYVEVKVNATALKDVKGNLVLNGNANETLGEDTDGFNKMLAVSGASTAVSNSDVKPVCPLFSNSMSPVDDTDADGNYVVRYTFGEVVKSVSSGLPTYDEGLSTTLNGIYRVQTIACGETAWKDASVTFAMDTTTKVYSLAIPASLIPAGTKYRLVTTYDPTASITYDGVAYKLSYKNSTTYEAGDTYTSAYYSKDTATIVTTGTASSGTYTESTIRAAQRSWLSIASEAVTYENSVGKGANFDVTCLNTTFAKYTDFIVTTVGKYGYKKVDSTVTVIAGADGKVSEVLITTTDNSYKTSDLLLWVGEGTTLTENATNEKQVSFGCGKDASYGDAAGYVRIYGSDYTN